MSHRKKMRGLPIDEDIEDIDINAVSDSEDDYTEGERNLLEKARTRRTSENYDSEDEVYGLRDEDEEDDEDIRDDIGSMASDIEGLEEDDNLPNERAWGKKKKAYYSTDYVDPDYASASQKDLDNAELEEKEARNIQKRLADQLDDADFGLEFIQVKEDTKDVEDETEQVVKTDLTKLSKRQKQALMQKESPEFMALVNDFKERMTEARDILAPFLKLVKNGICAECPAVTFVKTKYQLVLNYCINISFYLMLKAKRLPVSSHPVIKRLAQYRQLLSQLQSGEGDITKQIVEILEAEKKGLPLYNTIDGLKVSTAKKTRKSSNEIVQRSKKSLREQQKKTTEVEEEEEEGGEEENELDDDDSTIEQDMDGSHEMDIDENEEGGNDEDRTKVDAREDADGKRAITYQIAKNRGLTPHRKKELRNPRVKHRNKFRKAKIRRKGAVREVRKELSRYGGEISGIKASVKKSIKLK